MPATGETVAGIRAILGLYFKVLSREVGMWEWSRQARPLLSANSAANVLRRKNNESRSAILAVISMSGVIEE